MWNGGSFSHRLNRISAVMRLGKGICLPGSPPSTTAAFNARSKSEKSLHPSSEGGGSSVRRTWQSGLRHGMAAREHAYPPPRLQPPLLSKRDQNPKRASLPHPRAEAPLFSALIHGSQACATAWRQGNMHARLPDFDRRCFQCEIEIRKEPSSLIRGRRLLCSAR